MEQMYLSICSLHHILSVSLCLCVSTSITDSGVLNKDQRAMRVELQDERNVFSIVQRDESIRTSVHVSRQASLPHEWKRKRNIRKVSQTPGADLLLICRFEGALISLAYFLSHV